MSGRHISSDVTHESLRRIEGGATIKKLDVRGAQDVLATGAIRSIQLHPGVRAISGALNGQKGFHAKTAGLIGFNLEVRLEGASSAAPAENPTESTALAPGETCIVARHETVEWLVTAPAQPVLRTVSLSFQEDFLKEIDDRAVTAVAERHFRNRRHTVSMASPRTIAMAEEYSALVTLRPDARMQGLALALGILSDVCQGLQASREPVEAGNDARAQHAAEIIRQHCDARITIDDIARKCRVSPTTLKRVFRSHYGLSIGVFMRQARLERARDMLAAGTPVATVARSLRYSSPETLSRAYKVQFGHPPTRSPDRSH